jgi:hypothetical protein
MAHRVPLLLLVAAACLPARATDEVTYGSTSVMDEGPPPPPGQQKISFKPPQLDEEESESVALPDVYRCHACAAVAYQVESQYVARPPPPPPLPLVLPVHPCSVHGKIYG